MAWKIVYKEGEKLGKCIFIKDVEDIISKGGKRYRAARFRCKCGNEFVSDLQNVKAGNTFSCGCSVNVGDYFWRDYKDEYICFRGMQQRCYNVNGSGYPDYGGRGITICDRWLSSFANFIADMGRKPSKSHSIERTDTNGNYEPSNCKWATKKEQSRNQRSNFLVTYKDETKCFAEWCEILGLNYMAARQRITRGWQVSDAFEKPMTIKKKRNAFQSQLQ